MTGLIDSRARPLFSAFGRNPLCVDFSAAHILPFSRPPEAPPRLDFEPRRFTSLQVGTAIIVIIVELIVIILETILLLLIIIILLLLLLLLLLLFGDHARHPHPQKSDLVNSIAVNRLSCVCV